MYVLQNKTLFRRKNTLNTELYLLVIPSHMKTEILYEMHDALPGGHLRIAKTWNTTKPKGLLQPWTTIKKTFQQIGIDTLGKFPVTPRGNQYVFIMTDYLSRERISTKSKRRFDKNRQEIEYFPGDLVYLKKPNRKVGLSEKLLPQYSGPWEIIMKIAPNNYQITNHTRKKIDIVNVERLKKFNKRVDKVIKDMDPPQTKTKKQTQKLHDIDENERKDVITEKFIDDNDQIALKSLFEPEEIIEENKKILKHSYNLRERIKKPPPDVMEQNRKSSSRHRRSKRKTST
uniref:Tf2-1-like SH3-like domain-containing protein n=1 Tax=Strigamia maritima TaxID=126957 RepID=T1IN30_STRMM